MVAGPNRFVHLDPLAAELLGKGPMWLGLLSHLSQSGAGYRAIFASAQSHWGNLGVRYAILPDVEQLGSEIQ